MGRIFVIVGGLLVLLLTAALVVPPFVDWSGYRADFEREASRVLGRPVKVAGDVSARLLPFPSVAFSDVRVGSDATHPVMTVDTFSMDAELMPFLRGQLLIFDMRVDRPRATISWTKAARSIGRSARRHRLIRRKSSWSGFPLVTEQLPFAKRQAAAVIQLPDSMP